MSSEPVTMFARDFADQLLIIAFSVVISNRLVTSACAIVADTLGYTANLEKLMSKPFTSPSFLRQLILEFQTPPITRRSPRPLNS